MLTETEFNAFWNALWALYCNPEITKYIALTHYGPSAAERERSCQSHQYFCVILVARQSLVSNLKCGYNTIHLECSINQRHAH